MHGPSLEPKPSPPVVVGVLPRHYLAVPEFLFDSCMQHRLFVYEDDDLDREFGKAFENAASFGRVLPDLSMEHATEKPVVAEPMIEATEAALRAEAM